MTTPKVETFYNATNDRWYKHDETGLKVPGVSAIKSMLPAPKLMDWKARATAEYCVENIDTVKSLAAKDKDGAVELVKNSTNRYSKKASDTGTDVHAMCEQVMRDMMAGKKSTFHATAEDLKYLRNFARFVKEFEVKPLMVETTIWSQEYEYAGTFDLLCTLKGLKGNWIVDYKSGASGVYHEAGIQQTGYVYADSYVDDEGEFKPMPEVAGAFCMWLRPDGWALYPVRTDKVMWEQFLHLRESYRYKVEIAPSVVGKPINETPLKKVWKGRK